jgi:hypothetical protein
METGKESTLDSSIGETPEPPPWLREKLNDLIDPRFVVLDHRRILEPYHLLEESEAGVRHQTRTEFDQPLRLWLRAIALFQQAFSRKFEWPVGLSDDEKRAFDLREDLLGLAGGASKPTLDAILDGYYWLAYGMVRSLLETCRRTGYIRLKPTEAFPYFEAPTESPVGADGQPRRDRAKPVPFAKIKDAYDEASSQDQEIFNKVNAGITHMHAGSHPSPEGILQIYLKEGRKTFGPVFDRYWAAFGLKWGIFANLVLLAEVDALQVQGADWLADYSWLQDAYHTWQAAYNLEFVEPAEEGNEAEDE